MTNMQEAWENAKKEQKLKTNMRIVGKPVRGRGNNSWKETWQRRFERCKEESDNIIEDLICIMLYKKKHYNVPLQYSKNSVSKKCYRIFYIYDSRNSIELDTICNICGVYNVKLDLKVDDPNLSKDLIKIEKDIIQINILKGYTVDKIINRVFLAKLQYLIARMKVRNKYTTNTMATMYDIEGDSLARILDPRSRKLTPNSKVYNFSLITLLCIAKVVGAKVTISLLNGRQPIIKKGLLHEYLQTHAEGKKYGTKRGKFNLNDINYELNPEFYYKSMIPFGERNPNIRFEDTILKQVLVESDNIDKGIEIEPVSHEEDKPESNVKKVERTNPITPEVVPVDDKIIDNPVEEQPIEVSTVQKSSEEEQPKVETVPVASIEQVEVAIGGVTVTVPANIVDKDGKKVIRLAIDIAIK